MKSTISLYCQFGMHDQGLPAARLTCPVYIDVIIFFFFKISYYCCVHMKTFRTVWLLRNFTLDGKLCFRDDENAAFVQLCHPLPWQASIKNFTLCARISRKLFLIGWIHSLWGALSWWLVVGRWCSTLLATDSSPSVITIIIILHLYAPFLSLVK